MEQTNEQTLNIPTDHDVISKPMEQAMVEALKQSKKPRKRKQIHEYAEEVTQLTVKLHKETAFSSSILEAHNNMMREKYALTDSINYPSIRFALGLLFKAIKQCRF